MYTNAPRYLLRKFCALKLISDIPEKGRALDIGCGGGDMCATLLKQGYWVKGIDISEKAIDLCRERLKDIIDEKEIMFEVNSFENITESFDLIIFFEVLEHIEDEHKALDRIYQMLNPKGHLLLSVPAHKRRFGPSDRYVGHYRRYDKTELIQLLQRHKFEVSTIWNYGFPLANLTEAIRNIITSHKKIKSREEGTKSSGIERSIERRFRFVLNDVFLLPFYWLQMLFVSTRWGSGYIVKASKAN